ncbi:hydroxysteroid dehydrogenase-like protein 1 [Diaphorina citri]|uniref:Hydroxysteroid dehydrogenase-like protein 1 n=1 Tax=Diaphorina citri TaxID=121845 RepID=A0A3Q0IWN3_DIACI|nr:hydroxysteroid dehydrogenase-like protein 1 [Diaphorina citri]
MILILAVIGGFVVAVTVLHVLWKLVNGFRVHVIGQYVDLKQKYGSWAVVTGCTDGIGRAYAHELARRGINIVLISRTLEKLKKTAKEIESLHGVQTKIIAVDLSGTKAAIEAVKNQLGDHPVHILVNNVGSLSSYPKSLTEDTEKETWDTLSLNVVFTTLMTKLILPRMKDNGRGAIVNVSSISEASPWALFNVYAATKVS